jgi:hypothetical protein
MLNPLRHAHRHRCGEEGEDDDPEPQHWLRLKEGSQREADESRIEAVQSEVQEFRQAIEHPRRKGSEDHGHDVEGRHPPVEDSDGNHK